MSVTFGRYTTIVVFFFLLSTLTCFAASASSIQILSATVRDQRLSGAVITLQKNGEQSSTATTDSQGQAQVSRITADDPSALVIVRLPGYSDLVAKCPCADMTYALSPYMQNLDGMRIVLNWGASPPDLDGHLAYPKNHVWFVNKAANDAMLDIDHIDGFGPETITISRKHAGERYEYAVQDFSDKGDPNSDRMSQSDAKVFVYIGQTLIRSYYVPKHTVGNVWKVFAVSEAGEIQDINAVSSIAVQDSADLTPEKIFGAQFGTAQVAADTIPATSAEAAVTAQPISAIARKLNLQGETAYRRGNFAEAIRLFQAAIVEVDSYGQAYSNLGLAFQKQGRVAEALWANRKAIALAAGPTASTTRASTHFNNGRIYEEAGQWTDAQREYAMAQNEKVNSTYANAIQRMREHGSR